MAEVLIRPIARTKSQTRIRATHPVNPPFYPRNHATLSVCCTISGPESGSNRSISGSKRGHLLFRRRRLETPGLRQATSARNVKTVTLSISGRYLAIRTRRQKRAGLSAIRPYHTGPIQLPKTAFYRAVLAPFRSSHPCDKANLPSCLSVTHAIRPQLGVHASITRSNRRRC